MKDEHIRTMIEEAYNLAEEVPSGEEILRTCVELAQLLLGKNKAYGDSALNPRRTFAKSDTVEQIRVRIDDKLNRIEKGQAAGEDPEWDLLGYLVLLRIAKQRQKFGPRVTIPKEGPTLEQKTEFAEAVLGGPPLFSGLQMRGAISAVTTEDEEDLGTESGQDNGAG